VFWTIAAVALFAAALITFLPILRGKTLLQPLALALMFLLPVAGLWLYNDVGTPAAIGLNPVPREVDASDPHASGSQEMEAMISSLRSKLTQGPESLDGWMLLARTLKSVQRYPEAVEALETALTIAPDNSDVLAELAEASIYVTPDGRINEEIFAMLERALDLNPNQQKALWLMGMASAQAGDDAFAISYWQSLLEQLEPGSPVAQSVQSQIDGAQSRLGMEVEETPVVAESDGAWQGISLKISGPAEIPPGGVLYVMIRSPGPAVGPPIGVRRVVSPVLPLEMVLDDRDSMLKERQISFESEVLLQARISQTGSPAAAAGDWQSEPVTVAVDSQTSVELSIDQQVE